MPRRKIRNCLTAKTLCKGECDICHNRSLASHESAKYWSERNLPVTPRQVYKGNVTELYWYNCFKSKHEFAMRPNNVSKDQWCPYPCCCFTGTGKLCEDEDCDICFYGSFASHPNCYYWIEQELDGKILSPRKVKLNSHIKCWFRCENSHEFQMELYNINGGVWCPKCKFKNETECILIMEKLTKHLFIKKKVSFLNGLEYDGYNGILKIAIEYNGKQHYEYNKFFHRNNINNLYLQQFRDAMKKQLSEENEIFLIIVPYYVENKLNFIQTRMHKFYMLKICKEIEN